MGMKRKDVNNALKSGTPLNNLFALIPQKRMKAFKKFARGFGFTDERIDRLLRSERSSHEN